MAEEIKSTRVFLVMVNDTISVFSNYENAAKYCEKREIGLYNIIGAPLDTGYIIPSTHTVHNHPD